MENSTLTRDPEYGFPSLQNKIEFAEQTSCTSLTIYPSKAVGSTIATVHQATHEARNLTDEFLNGYLESGKNTAGAFRLIMGSCTFNPTTQCSVLPFTDKAMSLLKEHLSLPEEFDTALQQRSARAFKYSCRPSIGYIFKFGVYRPSYYHLALHYTPATKTTTALLISKTSHHAYASLVSSLLARPHLTNDPFFLPSLLSALVTNSSHDRIQGQDTMLNVLEESMGQHEYANRPVGNPLELDFMATTRRLSAVSRILQVEKMRLGSFLLSLEMMSEGRKILELEGENEVQMMSFKVEIDDVIGCQKNFTQNLLLRAEALIARAQSQVAVVYQFMAQKDSKINIHLAETSATIAEESKKDSAAMKAIAVLTMCFLPGTFLAMLMRWVGQALFAMPFFAWDSGSPTVGEGFKYYWAIAIPLTLVVLFLWGLSVWLPWHKWLSGLRQGSQSWDAESGILTRKKR